MLVEQPHISPHTQTSRLTDWVVTVTKIRILEIKIHVPGPEYKSGVAFLRVVKGHRTCSVEIIIITVTTVYNPHQAPFAA